MRPLIKPPALSINTIVLISALALTLFYNQAFYRNVLDSFPLAEGNTLFVFSLAVLVFALSVILLGMLASKYSIKVMLIVLFPLAACANFAMNSYNVVIDSEMLRNVLETDSRETVDLLSVNAAVNLLVLGILPAVCVYYINLKTLGFWNELKTRLAMIGAAFAVIVVVLFMSSGQFATFFREYKLLRYYTNPITWVYSSGKLIAENLQSLEPVEKTLIGLDAHIPEDDNDRELVIVVVGETARGDHFSLNGYERNTNPLLTQESVVSFSNMQSCATTTAVSLPCMFSLQNANDFSVSNAEDQENLLDVLVHAGVHVLWRDNNSDSKGVAQPEIFEDWRSPEVNPVCDVECRDIGMLHGLDDYIEEQESGDIIVVLHQMGNHGPAYFQRYPEEFERFKPACHTNQLQDCSNEEIVNAYDNAIAYTDYFLSEVIEFLRGYDQEFETVMFYVSDHGESLGEHSLYLHGLPPLLAPVEQKNVAATLWFGERYDFPISEIQPKADKLFSHDNVFHTILGIMEIQTSIYNAELDILHNPI